MGTFLLFEDLLMNFSLVAIKACKADRENFADSDQEIGSRKRKVASWDVGRIDHLSGGK